MVVAERCVEGAPYAAGDAGLERELDAVVGRQPLLGKRQKSE